MSLMNIRKAARADLEALQAIYEEACRRMHAQGNPQWPQAPSIEELEELLPELRVLEENGLQGAFVLTGADPCYKVIDGTWLQNGPYVTLHKTVSAFRSRGIGHEIIAFARKTGLPVRIDTHEKNLPMQKLLEKEGFVRCGTIRLANGEPRLAYEFAPAVPTV